MWRFVMSKQTQDSFTGFQITAWKFRHSSFRVFLPVISGIVLIAFTVVGCLNGGGTGPDNNQNTPTPSQQTLAFVVSQSGAATTDLQRLDVECDLQPAGPQRSWAARLDWRTARHDYELIRFAYDGFDAVLGYQIAAWLSDTIDLAKPNYRGFHYVETLLWAHAGDSVTFNGTLYNPVLNMATATLQPSGIQGVMQNTLSDTKIFTGLLGMLADIDSLKLSRLDSNYSKNSVNDVLSNLEGLDTVINYYIPRNNPPAAFVGVDTAYVNAYTKAWNAWEANVSNYYSSSFDPHTQFAVPYLYPLETAVTNIKAKLGY